MEFADGPPVSFETGGFFKGRNLPSNRRVSFAGEERRICGMSNRAEIVNPTQEDVKNAFTVLRKYRE